MQVEDFRSFVSVAKLGSLDKGTKGITIFRTDAYRAHFQGAHCEALRTDLDGKIEIVGLETGQMIAVGLDLVTGALALLPDGQKLRAKLIKGTLHLRTSSRHVRLRVRVDAAYDPELKPKASGRPLRVLCSADDLLEPLKFLSACTADGVDRPILTGVHFAYSRGQLSLSATNAEGKAGITRSIDREVKNPFRPFVVQVADLSIALNLFAQEFGSGTRKVNLSSAERKMYIFSRNRGLVVSFSLLLGDWPDLSRLPREFKNTYQLDSKRVQEVAQAAVLFDDDRLVDFEVADKRVSMKAAGQELGGYRVAFAGEALPIADVTITLDAQWLEALAHLGPKILLEYNGERDTLRFMSLDRKSAYWVSPIYRKTLVEK